MTKGLNKLNEKRADPPLTKAIQKLRATKVRIIQRDVQVVLFFFFLNKRDFFGLNQVAVQVFLSSQVAGVNLIKFLVGENVPDGGMGRC